MHCPWMPLYLIAGKRTQPFGLFEDRLVSGTLTEDLYEIKEEGITLGIRPNLYKTDLSFTIYRGQNVIENLENFDTYKRSRRTS
jgi:hypothetical protein